MLEKQKREREREEPKLGLIGLLKGSLHWVQFKMATPDVQTTTCNAFFTYARFSIGLCYNWIFTGTWNPNISKMFQKLYNNKPSNSKPSKPFFIELHKCIILEIWNLKFEKKLYHENIKKASFKKIVVQCAYMKKQTQNICEMYSFVNYKVHFWRLSFSTIWSYNYFGHILHISGCYNF